MVRNIVKVVSASTPDKLKSEVSLVLCTVEPERIVSVSHSHAVRDDADVFTALIVLGYDRKR